MFKQLIGAFLLLLASFSNAVDRLGCEISDPNVEIEITNEYDIATICNPRYTSFYSNLDRIPYVVTERIGKTNLAHKEQRTNDFRADLRLKPKARSTLKDYYRSNYDKGHLAPSANYTEHSDISQTFILSNIVPQNPSMNRTLWKNIENYARLKANLYGQAFIITGVTFNHCLIEEKLKDRVAVPDKMFKVVYYNGQYDVFLADNIKPLSTKPLDYKITLAELNNKLCSMRITINE